MRITACALLLGAPARAASGNVCADAAFRGQTLRNDQRLLEAREELRACARQECPAFVQKDCSEWLDDVEKRLPSVVVSASDPSGADLVDVTVTVDGQVLREKLDGQSLPMNAGHHTFVLARADGGSATSEVVLAEGEKGRRVSLVIGASALPASSAPLASVPAAPLPPAPARRSNPWNVAGLAVASAGIIGLGVGTVFGVLAIADKSDARCDRGGVCSNPAALGDLRQSSAVATATLLGGGALVVGGAAFVLFSRPASPARAQGLRVTPLIDATRAGLAVAGSF
jgi:hypothetical protein